MLHDAKRRVATRHGTTRRDAARRNAMRRDATQRNTTLLVDKSNVLTGGNMVVNPAPCALPRP
eukprot:8691935-Lingulodinium_polyedra.AAC.1